MFKFIPVFLLSIIPCLLTGQSEICANGIDDDNDNLIDLNDSDCACQIITSTSLIPNPSFEKLDCCPDDRSQLYCATDWIQASGPTTDFIHLCGYTGLNEYPPPRPFPDGQGILGFRDGRLASMDTLDAYWKEYAGACLLSPLKADSLYRLQFDLGFSDPLTSPPINVSLFGTPSCEFLPFGVGDVTFGCPSKSPDWVKLGDVQVSGGMGNSWVKAFIDLVPDTDIAAIAIGPDCDPVESTVAIYYYFDNLLLIDLESFDLLITENLHPCNQNFTLSVPNDPDLNYQWYLEGVALVGESSAEMAQNYGEGSYQVRILSGTSCRVSTPYEYIIPTFNSADTLSICTGDVFTFGELELTDAGFYLDTIKTKNNCDSIVALQLEVIGIDEDTIEVTIAPGESYQLADQLYTAEGEYSLSVSSSLGCDSLLLLKIIHFDVFIPNVFSPDDDGVNDLFLPFAPDDEVLSYDMKIYDRWGGLVFEGDAWDGAGLSPDIFIYRIEVDFINGESNTFYGSVALLR